MTAKEKIEALGLILHNGEWMTAKPRVIHGVEDYDEWENNRSKAAIIIVNAMKGEKI